MNEDVAKVSEIGVGMRSHAGVAKTMFSALAEKGVNIQVISTSEIKISVLIDSAYTELAVRALHAAYSWTSFRGDRVDLAPTNRSVKPFLALHQIKAGISVQPRDAVINCSLVAIPLGRPDRERPTQETS